MKKFLTIIIILLFALCSGAQVQPTNQRQTTIQLAVKYYNEKNFEKAAPLFKDVLKISSSKHYFKLYLTCLIGLKQFDEAEKEIKGELKRRRFPEPELYVHWGYLLKQQERIEEAEKKYRQAIKSMHKDRLSYLNTANLFIQWREFEYAKNIYLMAREDLEGEQLYYELARAYYYLRDYDNMMEEYLNYLKTDERRLPQIQSTIGSAMNLDFEDELKSKFRAQVLKRIQAEPEILVYNKLYIWFLLQEQKFSAALRQSIALDRRTGNEDARIANLANIAANNREYEEARRAYEYLMGKGEKNPYYLLSFIQNLSLSYLMFEDGSLNDPEAGHKLAEAFEQGLQYLGYTTISFPVVKDYAHLLAFRLKQPEKAIEELEKGISIRGLKPVEVGQLKTEMADIYVYVNDPWEATLIYSQVIEENKENWLGDEVKLKKAKLSYYLGNFDWAKAQLDVIKASTSKLTANDAFELSLLIGANLDLDTTSIPLQMFSRADYQFFRNEDSLALATIDSIENIFPYHTLVDDILYRKAIIKNRNGDYAGAADHLEKIIADFSYDALADDALFLLADIYQFRLDDPEKAQELYNQMLVIQPGSIYVVESRKRFRKLRGDLPEEEIPKTDREELFFNGFVF